MSLRLMERTHWFITSSSCTGSEWSVFPMRGAFCVLFPLHLHPCPFFRAGVGVPDHRLCPLPAPSPLSCLLSIINLFLSPFTYSQWILFV